MAISMIPTDAVTEIGGNCLNCGPARESHSGGNLFIPADCAEHYSHAGIWHATT
jgi:hypothetical protein